MENSIQEMNHCNQCGGEVAGHYRACPYCGVQIEHNQKQEVIINTERMVEDVVINEIRSASVRTVRPDSKAFTPQSRMSNGKKVFLTCVSSMVPLLGQIYGLINAILLINNEENEDSIEFGKALLACSLTMFFVQCIFVMIFWILLYSAFIY